MTPSANAKQRATIWLVLAFVALATPTFAADRTVQVAADAPLLDWILEVALPVVAYIQAGPVVFAAVLLPADESTPQPAEAPDTDKDSGKNGVILEDGAPF